MRQYIAAAAVAGLLLGTTASADSTADLTVDSGSLATVQLVVQITTSFGTDTDDDSVTQAFTGVGTAVVDSDVPPFLSLALPSLSFDLGSADFGFQFFCLPIIGCQALNVSVSLLGDGETGSGVGVGAEQHMIEQRTRAQPRIVERVMGPRSVIVQSIGQLS